MKDYKVGYELNGRQNEIIVRAKDIMDAMINVKERFDGCKILWAEVVE